MDEENKKPLDEGTEEETKKETSTPVVKEEGMLETPEEETSETE